MKIEIQQAFDAKFAEIGEEKWHDTPCDEIFKFGYEAANESAAIEINRLAQSGNAPNALKAFIQAWDACGKYPETQADIDALDEAYALAVAAQEQQPANNGFEAFWKAEQVRLNSNAYAYEPLEVGYFRCWKAAHVQQESQWLKTPPPENKGEFLAAFYFKSRPHDVMRRVVRFVDKDVVLVGWLPIPPAPEGRSK